MKRIALFVFSVALFSLASANAEAGFGWFKCCHKKSCCQTYTVCCQPTCCDAAPSCCGGEAGHAESLPMGENIAPAPVPYDEAAPMPPADKGPAAAPAPAAPAPKAEADAAPAAPVVAPAAEN